MGALSRLRLSPEGFSFEQMVSLTEFLRKRGCLHFTLSFHSSTLLAGFTPYSATPSDVDVVLGKIRSYLHYFAHEVGGRFATPTQIFEVESRRRRENAP